MHSSQIYAHLSRNGDELFHDLYGEIADATPLEGMWKARALINELPSIQHYAPKYQSEIIGCMLKRMRELKAPDHGLTRYSGGWYVWRFPENLENAA